MQVSRKDPIRFSDRKPSDLSWRLVKSDGRAPDIVAFEEAVIEFFLDAAALLGVPNSVAAIYGICFASPEALSFSDIISRLNISSGSVSQGLRVLKEVGALKCSSTGNSPTASSQRSSLSAVTRETTRYEPDLALRKLVLHWIENHLQKQIISGRKRLKRIEIAAPSHPSASAAVLHERLAALRTWHGKAGALIPVAKGFLKLS
jgi:HTH-type transcriptional regulator, glycine betaine synthesis regulator